MRKKQCCFKKWLTALSRITSQHCFKKWPIAYFLKQVHYKSHHKEFLERIIFFLQNDKLFIYLILLISSIFIFDEPLNRMLYYNLMDCNTQDRYYRTRVPVLVLALLAQDVPSALRNSAPRSVLELHAQDSHSCLALVYRTQHCMS